MPEEARDARRDLRRVLVLGVVTLIGLALLWAWLFHPEPRIPEPPPTAPARLQRR